MGVYDIDGNAIGSSGIPKYTLEVLVASSTAPESIKANADYICTGVNDEAVIQNAVDYVAQNHGGKVQLSSGVFYISSFPKTDSAGDSVAILVPQGDRYYAIDIVGTDLVWGIGLREDQKGTILAVSHSCYESLSSSSRYTVLRGGYVSRQRNSNIQCSVRNLMVYLPANQKPITCIDFLYMNRAFLEKVIARGYEYGYNGLVSGSTPPAAVQNCIGFRSVGGSNAGVLIDFRNCLATGFYEAFAIGGEHFIGIQLSAMYNVYGYTFGNYSWTDAFLHPITLINCCDENDVNLPLFANNSGKQAVNLIDFNIEWGIASVTPGGVVGDHAKETTPGKFCGNINYTMCYGGVWSANNVTEPFWESGSGHSIQTKNDAQELSGTSALRRTYAPNFMQQYFDTTANKLLICTDPANKTWVDADGNVVS